VPHGKFTNQVLDATWCQYKMPVSKLSKQHRISLISAKNGTIRLCPSQINQAMANRENLVRVLCFQTRLGWIAVALRPSALCGLVFGYRSGPQAETALRRLLPQSSLENGHSLATSDENKDGNYETTLISRLKQFATGAEVNFGDVQIRTDHLTPFGRRVVLACRRVGWGQTSTYGALAARCGSPGAARAVGQVMASNRFPLVVPCHRILATGGRMGGFSAPQGVRMKRRLLEMERVAEKAGRRGLGAVR
jgi:methylated-DNA-[protein]-cysteine S-methyltransferase